MKNEYGLLGSITTSGLGECLSVESLTDINEVMLSTEATASIVADVDNIRDAMNSVISAECALATIDASIADASVDVGTMTSELGNLATEAAVLLGEQALGELGIEVLAALCITDLALGVEAYKKKRSGFMDNIIKRVMDGIDNLTSLDSWKTAYKVLTALVAVEKKRINTLKLYQEELKSGDRVLKKISDVKLPSGVKRLLGLYSSRHGKFTFKRMDKFLSEYYDLFSKGLFDDTLKDVHDGLVQSIDNEATLPKRRDSIGFVSAFKKIDLSGVVYVDTVIAIPYVATGNVLRVLGIVQDKEDGMDFTMVNQRIPNAVYEDTETDGGTAKEMLTLINTVLSETRNMREFSSSKQTAMLIKEWVKNFRSAIATILYKSVFNVFAIRRLIRQNHLANNFIDHLVTARINLYGEWTTVMDLTILLIDAHTERK
ncbi:MAG: hypothetical protein Q9M11_03455 [Mariprofundaceae bacterium]|nr:hypothetical protein [Mariprofundaceae bacterium]